MPQKIKSIAVAEEAIINKIYLIRGQKVMIDRDLAELYGVETKALKQAVRRNKERFPPDFMFEMSLEELDNWRSQFVTSKEDKQGLRYAPFCFTEQGVTMLSCVLNSERAIAVNILVNLEQIEKTLLQHDTRMNEHEVEIQMILEKLTEMLNPPDVPRPRIGFRRNDELD